MTKMNNTPPEQPNVSRETILTNYDITCQSSAVTKVIQTANGDMYFEHKYAMGYNDTEAIAEWLSFYKDKPYKFIHQIDQRYNDGLYFTIFSEVQ